MGKLIVCEVKIAVYGDYDGNAPDTDNLLLVDTQEEADKIITNLKLVRDDGEEDSVKEARGWLDIKHVCQPYVEGWQHALTFKTRQVYVPVKGFTSIPRD